MKRVLQHSKTGLFLGVQGGFTRYPAEACAFPTLAAAMITCTRLHVDPTEFVYRIVGPDDASICVDFGVRHEAA